VTTANGSELDGRQIEPTEPVRIRQDVAYQQTIFQQSQPAAMFYTDDVRGDSDRGDLMFREAETAPKAHLGLLAVTQ
jgi:hypothetical protein